MSISLSKAIQESVSIGNRGERWIISFSKNKGELSIKEKKKRDKEKIIEDLQKSELYKKVKGYFSDAELIDVHSNNGDQEND